MSAPILPPQQWIAAANMVQRRGEMLRVEVAQGTVVYLALPDGTRLSYVNALEARAFRNVEQAHTALRSYALAIPQIIHVMGT